MFENNFKRLIDILGEIEEEVKKEREDARKPNKTGARQ